MERGLQQHGWRTCCYKFVRRAPDCCCRSSEEDEEYGMRVCIASEPGEWVLPSMATQVALSVKGSFGRAVAPGAPLFQDAFVFTK